MSVITSKLAVNHNTLIYILYTHLYLSAQSSCRATEWPFWFGFILPFAVIYTFNWVMFFVILVSIWKHTSVVGEPHLKKLKQNFVVAVALATVFGLAWGLGLLTTSTSVEELTLTLQIIFTIFVGSQGVLIFVFHGIRSNDAREIWKEWFRALAGKFYKTHLFSRPGIITPEARKQSSLSSSVPCLSYGLSTLGNQSSSTANSKVTDAQVKSSANDETRFVATGSQT